jgi:hypothetical protein
MALSGLQCSGCTHVPGKVLYCSGRGMKAAHHLCEQLLVALASLSQVSLTFTLRWHHIALCMIVNITTSSGAAAFCSTICVLPRNHCASSGALCALLHDAHFALTAMVSHTCMICCKCTGGLLAAPYRKRAVCVVAHSISAAQVYRCSYA